MSGGRNPHASSALDASCEAVAAARRAVITTRIAFLFAALAFAFNVYNLLMDLAG